MSFNDLELHPSIQKSIQQCGFDRATEIQKQAIPKVLLGHDLIATAQTGTGKTAAFVLPALQMLFRKRSNAAIGARVLILTPTRELANQVNANIQQFSRFMRARNGTIVGGTPYPPQIKMLRRPLDLLVATPGRCIDHIQNGHLDLSEVEMFVLDEADRMLDMGFIQDVELIASKLPAKRQTLLFSATFDKQIKRIAAKLLNQPQFVHLATATDQHKLIRQHIHQADDIRHKHALLNKLLNDKSVSQAVVFTATKRGADRLSQQLSNQGHSAGALHGDMKQSARKRTIEQMRRKKLRILVATDVAARGIDIKDITHVINFDLPSIAEDYIHRIGRTGRAGADGTAISLVGPQDWGNLANIEKLTGRNLERMSITGLEAKSAEPSALFTRKRNFRPSPKRKPVVKHKRSVRRTEVGHSASR